MREEVREIAGKVAGEVARGSTHLVDHHLNLLERHVTSERVELVHLLEDQRDDDLLVARELELQRVDRALLLLLRRLVVQKLRELR